MTGAVSRRALARWLVSRTRGLLPSLACATLARIAGHLLGVGILVVAAHAVVAAAGSAHVPLLPLALVVVALSFGKAGLRYLEHYLGHRVAFTALQRLRQLLFERLIPQAPAATTGRASAELTERATRDIDRIEVFFAHTIPPVIASVVVPAIALAWLAAQAGPLPAVIIAGFLACALLLPFLAARPAWAASRAHLAARAEVATHVADDVQGLREVLAFDAATTRRDALGRRERVAECAQRRIGRIVAVRGGIERVLWVGCLITLFATASSAGELALALAVLLGLWLSGSGTDDFATGLDAALAACDRVRRVVEAPPLVADAGTRADPGTGAARIEVRDVSFAYPGNGGGALAGVHLRCDPGTWHTVTGPSGSGKSTLAALLVRAWDPDGGRILLDGTPLADLTLDALRRAVAVVDQRPVLFPGTLAENLRLAAPDAADAALGDALHAAGLPADEFPDGLRTVIGERGSTLSGGQLQRVAIARALVAGPRVLVLDEALSQLDADAAGIVRERLSDRGTTVIEITHRTDLIPDAGPVTVIDRGAIVEQGPAGRLRAGDGAFARLARRS